MSLYWTMIDMRCAGIGMLLISMAPITWVLIVGVAISGMCPGWVWTSFSDVVQDTVTAGERAHALLLISGDDVRGHSGWSCGVVRGGFPVAAGLCRCGRGRLPCGGVEYAGATVRADEERAAL